MFAITYNTSRTEYAYVTAYVAADDVKAAKRALAAHLGRKACPAGCDIWPVEVAPADAQVIGA